MDSTNELARFKKSFLLHASRYNLYSNELLIKGSTGRHNRAIEAYGKLEDKVLANPLLYADLLMELLQDSDPKVSMLAGFACLKANVHAEKAKAILTHIAKNTSGLSLLCAMDISGTILQFERRQREARPRNEVDAIVKKMKGSDSGETYADDELFDMALKLQDINMCGYDERTLLMHACLCHRVTLVQRLLDLGADVHKIDYAQKTALHCAAAVGDMEIVTCLLEHHANVNEQEKRGFTALDFAKVNCCQLPQEEIDKLVDFLISRGAKTKSELEIRRTED